MKRFYFSITNHCNRRCAPCCCYSRPERSTFLSFEKYKEIIPDHGDFEIQIEGGEPLLHPMWREMIAYATATGRCKKTTLGTNGSLLPYQYDGDKLNSEASIISIRNFFTRLESPLALKMSINQYLYTEDPELFEKAVIVKKAFEALESDGDYELILNVRLRKSTEAREEDAEIMRILKESDLMKHANVYFFQRYGFASDQLELDLPSIIANPADFYLICPEGVNWERDLLGRSEAMKEMR